MATRNSSLAVATGNGEYVDVLGQKLKWHESVPRQISAAGAWGPGTDGWKAWAGYLSQRRRPKTLAQRLPSRGSPLAWSLPADQLKPGTALMIARLHNLSEKKWLREKKRLSGKKRRVLHPLAAELEPWLKTVAGVPPGVARAAECLAWCHALPHLAEVVPADVWWQTLTVLIDVAAEPELEIESDPLTHQLAAGELPLTLSYLFPEIQSCRQLAAQGRRCLSAGLDVLLDGEGLPAARHLELLRPLLACWTRSRVLAAGVKRGCWDEPAQMQYEWVARQAVRFCRADGTQPLCRGAAATWEPELFDAALAVGGDADDRDIARIAIPKRPNAAGRERARLPSAAYHCEWAEAGMLRPDWKRGGPMLAVTWNGGVVQTELAIGQHVLWSGPWEAQLTFNGKSAHPQSDWDVICWDSDSDADYLELEMALTGDLRLQRQLLMTREDNLLLAADAVLADRPGNIEYQGTFPLDGQVEFQPANKNHEGMLADRKARARVLPLALPEWRSEQAAGGLDCLEHKLRIRMEATGRALYAPLLLDLDARRLARKFSWRRLTVSEDRRIVPTDTAVGFRVQLGNEQWLVYRSLAKIASRSLLGHNLVTEFLFARFEQDGEVEPLLEVE